jgi:hypothetical protein
LPGFSLNITVSCVFYYSLFNEITPQNPHERSGLRKLSLLKGLSFQ